jgi:hypothetical protein
MQLNKDFFGVVALLSDACMRSTQIWRAAMQHVIMHGHIPVETTLSMG